MIGVAWEDGAAADIDAAWSAATQAGRSRITAAVERIHKALSEAPLEFGESRQDAYTRVGVAPPVSVHFRFYEKQSLVRVFAARVYQQS